MWEKLQNNADWDCFKTPILQEILRTRNPLQVEHCVLSEATRSLQSAGCVRNKLQFRTAQQNPKSFPWMQALDLWDLIVTVLHGNTNQSKHVQENLSKSPTRKKILGMIDDLDNVDFISSNANSSRKEPMLYIFEDNEAVIKMILKGEVLQ